MTGSTRLPLATVLRLAARDLRGGLRGYWIFLACIALGVAAIAGAIMGACHGAERFPADAVAALLAANPELRLEALAADLLALRTGAGG